VERQRDDISKWGLDKKLPIWLVDFYYYHPTKDNPKIPQFYITAKIHKLPWAGRPIVQNMQWYTTPYAIIASHYISLLLDTHCADYILHDSLDLTNRLEAANLDINWSFCSADVESMYTNIDSKEIMEALDYILAIDLNYHTPVLGLNYNLHIFIKMCTKFTCDNTYFTETTYGCFRQIFGIAMSS
jgi:hypothetical protein